MRKIVGGAIIAILFVLILAGALQWHTYEKKVEYRQEALLYFKEKDYSKTISYLKNALGQWSVFGGRLDQDMNCYLAESYYQLKEYGKAEKIYDKLIKKDEKNMQYYLLKGECVEETGEDAQAVAIYEQGFKKTEDTDFLKKICELYTEKKDYTNALKYAQKGADQGGEVKASFLFQKIVIYEKAQEYQKAYEMAGEYLKLYPDDEDAKKEYTFLATRI